MKFILGKDRNQTEIICLDQLISDNNEIRLIDLFVNSIKLSEFGFKTEFIDNGRPAYQPSFRLIEIIYLWVFEPHSFVSTIRKRV